MAHINIMYRQPISVQQAMSLYNNLKKTRTVNSSFMSQACFSKQLNCKQHVSASNWTVNKCKLNTMILDRVANRDTIKAISSIKCKPVCQTTITKPPEPFSEVNTMCHVPTPKISIQYKTGHTQWTPLRNRHNLIESVTRLAPKLGKPQLLSTEFSPSWNMRTTKPLPTP